QAKKNTNPNFLLMGLVNTKSFTSDSSSAASNKTNIQANIKRHMDFIDRLLPEGVEFFGFPEMSINGYHFSNFTTWLKLDGPEVKAFKDKAKDKGIYISVGLAEVDAADKKWNTHIVIDPKGEIIGKHHKIWLTAEKGFTEAGT